MKIILTLAWRNLWRNKRRSLITISSVLFAVLLAIVFYSMEQRLLRTDDRQRDDHSTGYIQIQDVFYEDEPPVTTVCCTMTNLPGCWLSWQQIAIRYRLQNFALVATEGQTRGLWWWASIQEQN